MAPRNISESNLLDAVATLFRSNGFAAVSIADVASATGLQKSSLYHRFPDGKQQMAGEAARHLAVQFADALAPLRDEGPTRTRVRTAGRRLSDFYDGGRSNCLLEALSLADPGSDARTTVEQALAAWVGEFAHIARLNGATPMAATAAAQDAVASIQGARVVTRLSGDTAPFDRAIERLPDLLLCP